MRAMSVRDSFNLSSLEAIFNKNNEHIKNTTHNSNKENVNHSVVA